ncbi:MAG TPA: hypothetical protein VF384_03100 [Planctomycetota bacterium]
MSRSSSCLPAAALAIGAVLAFASCHVPSPGEYDAQRPTNLPQIEWQRTLEDAQALAKAEQRPLFIAVNMDGESASDRIWRENYRDPAFVEAANKCVCVAASVFRHNPRDYDEQGRRIPCPRLGNVTCGEHMVMEPKLFEQLLADGERVAPRHALVLPDGKKVFDLSLCFDLHDVDRALFAAVKDIPPREVPPADSAGWPELAARRDHAGRCVLEERIARSNETETVAALAAIGSAGDAGALDALRTVGWPQLSKSLLPAGTYGYEVLELVPGVPLSGELRKALADAARARGLSTTLAGVWFEHIDIAHTGIAWFGGRVRDDKEGALALIAELDGRNPPTRSFLLTQCLLAPYADAALRALRQALPANEVAALETCLRELGPPLDDPRRPPDAPRSTPRVSPAWNAMREAPELAQELDHLDRTPAADRNADWHARFAKASLDLGRRHLETREKDTMFLLEDAETHWKKALALLPDRADWWIERARTAYFLGNFADQIDHGQRAFTIVTGKQPEAPLSDRLAVEALRWVGDGNARLLGERAKGDAVTELRGIAAGLRALLRVTQSDYGTAKDWLSLVSFFGALSLKGAEFATANQAVRRFPADRDLRLYFQDALRFGPHGTVWTFEGARGERLISACSRFVAVEHPDSADAQWWAGYANVLTAEDDRRCDRPPGLWLPAYEAAQQFFARAMELNADYAASCRSMIALTWLGRGLAWVQGGYFADRGRAADCLVEAVKVQPALAELRDGLGYDVLDLVDKIFEWRDAGPSDVDAMQLLDRLLAAAPGDPFYGLAIADSQLREALRADGRNPQRVERETVDASGSKIRMPMGLATADGDAYLQRSLEAARRVLPFTKTPEDKKLLAQSATIHAERQLERYNLDGVAAALVEAASLLDMPPPPATLDAATASAFAAQLRAALGPARPRDRAGR